MKRHLYMAAAVSIIGLALGATVVRLAGQAGTRQPSTAIEAAPGAAQEPPPAQPLVAQEVPLPPGTADTIDARMAARRAADMQAGAQDPALPPGTADSLEARMAVRRAAQVAADNAAATQTAGPSGRANAAQARAAAAGGFGGGFGGGAPPTPRGGFGTPAAPAQTRNTLAEKKIAPVFEGADPEKIPLTETIITQIIPLRYADAIRTRNDLLPFISADADTAANPASNSIIITDTAARIHRVAELIAKLDVITATRASRGNTASAGTFTVISGPAIGRGTVMAGLAPGTWQAAVTAPTAPIIAGADHLVAQVPAAEGQTIRKGDVIIALDNTAELAELRIAEARLQVARAAARGTTEGTPDRARADAQIAVEEATLELQKKHIDALQLKAPFDGTLTTMEAKPGAAARSGQILTQVVGHDLGITWTVPPSAASGFKTGQRLQFTWAGPAGETTVAAELSYISPVVDPATGVVEVHARLSEFPQGLKPGMTGIIKTSDK